MIKVVIIRFRIVRQLSGSGRLLLRGRPYSLLPHRLLPLGMATVSRIGSGLRSQEEGGLDREHHLGVEELIYLVGTTVSSR
jgi:hypothetical protein